MDTATLQAVREGLQDQAANGAGGPDNITAILIYFPSE